MAQMSDETLLLELDSLSKDATGNNSTFITENEELLNRYEGNPYGDETAERSKVISNDCMDIVESDMPSLTRIFLGSTEVVKFKPNSRKEEDVKEAEDKTTYVNWQIRSQPWSFTVLHGFIKNAEIHKLSVVKYFFEETTEIEEHKKTGLSNEDLALYKESLEGEDVKSVEMDRQEENDDEDNTIVFKVKRETKGVRIVDVPLETFRMTKNATDKNTAQLVGDVSLVTRGELVARGIPKSKVKELQLANPSSVSENSRLPDIRNEDEGGTDNQIELNDWANEEVKIEDLYPMIDYDGDGIAERRHIMRSGEIILTNEVFNHVPYATMSAIMMPHKAIGKSRVEITAPTALAKTAILRGVNDNIYAVNNPRIAANKNVNMDDLLVMRPNGVIRTSKDTSPAESLFPVEIPYIGDKALQVIQYWDQARAQTTGSLLASQGLSADDLGKETATRFTGIEDASKGKIELVARVMSETGFRELFEGVAWLDANFQNTAIEVEILGEELKTNPSEWKFKHHVVSKVGLGAGDDQQFLTTMGGLWSLHQQLQQSGSPMTDEVKRYNVIKNLVNGSGLPEVDEFFNNPEREEDLVVAQNEILTNLVKQLQEQLQSLQNPLAEAETIKAQAGLLKAQGEQRLSAAEFIEDQRQFNATLKNDQTEFNKEMALKLTTLEKTMRDNFEASTRV